MFVLAFLASAVVVVAFLLPVLLVRRPVPPRAQDTSVSFGNVLPKVIQNSTIAYALGLVTLAPLFAWGVNGGHFPALVYLACAGLGLLLVFLLRRPIVDFLADALSNDHSVTVHEFIARRHGDDRRVRSVAAILTLLALFGLVICELLGVAAVLKPLLADSVVVTEAFTAVILVVVVAGAIFSGHTGVMHAAQLQLGLFFFGLFGATALLLYLQVSELGALPLRGTLAIVLVAVVGAIIYSYRRVRYVDTASVRFGSTQEPEAASERKSLPLELLRRIHKILNSLIAILAITLIVLALVVASIELYVTEVMEITVEDVGAAAEAVWPLSAPTMIALVLLPLFHPIVDIVNWQRFAAFAKTRHWSYFKDGQWAAAFKSFTATYAVEVPVVGLLFLLFAVIAGLTFATPVGSGALQAFIGRLVEQENFVATAVLALFLPGLLALAVSTMGSLVSAGLCTFRFDLLPVLQSGRTPPGAAADASAQRRTAYAGAAFGIAALLAFCLADARFQVAFAGPAFLGLVFGFSSLQLSFVPLVVAPLIAGTSPAGRLGSSWALTIMIVSAAVGIALVVVGLATRSDVLLAWAVPGSLGSALLIFCIAFLSRRRVASAK
jgi:hypothetical protein